MNDMTEQTGDAINKKIADAPYHLTAEDQFGVRSMISYGTLAEVREIKALVRPESNPSIDKNNA